MAKKAVARVVIPTNIKERLELAGKVYAKHVADGNNSILNHVDGLNWAVTGPTIATAKQLHEEAEELKRQMENKYKERDLLLKPIDEDLNLSTTNYKAVYAVNPKKMGDFGYTVDDTPRKKGGKN
jgi:hypothetical protein